jgi:hypothetical protein
MFGLISKSCPSKAVLYKKTAPKQFFDKLKLINKLNFTVLISSTISGFNKVEVFQN